MENQYYAKRGTIGLKNQSFELYYVFKVGGKDEQSIPFDTLKEAEYVAKQRNITKNYAL